jgi:integrase
MGSLYRQKASRFWWIKYYAHGRQVRESTGTENEKKGERILREREGRAAAGLPVIPRADKIRYEEIAADLRQHYATTGSRSLVEVEKRLKHLDRYFRGWRIVGITGATATAYVAARQAQHVSNATINRDLAVLTKMLRLAYENSKLLRLPVIRKLKESAPRQGFFEPEQFLAVRRHLREDLQLAVTIAYTYGWRMQSEVLTLERRQLDLVAGTLRLEPGMTKNDEGRLVYLTPELKAMLGAQVERVRELERQIGRIIPHVFPHFRLPARGQRLQNFRGLWKKACRKAGVPGMLRHDFRRTAVRNLVNAGVPERVAMTITGHKTRSVFDRYHIVSPGDLREATAKLTGIATGIVSANPPAK